MHILSPQTLTKYIEANMIEVAPLAYMRGRTLSNAFVILDEAQNTTIVQMKMFLSRIGENSKTVIAGDSTQIDLPKSVESGFTHALEILKNIDGIGFHKFGNKDIVRHSLVSKILSCYDSNGV